MAMRSSTLKSGCLRSLSSTATTMESKATRPLIKMLAWPLVMGSNEPG